VTDSATSNPPAEAPVDQVASDQAVLATEAPTEAPAPENAEPQVTVVSQSEQRRLMAASASRMLDAGDELCLHLDWYTLSQCPDWLGLPDPVFASLQRRLGAIVYAAQIRLWIDQPRLSAARQAVGAPWLHRLCSQRAILPLPMEGFESESIDKPEQVVGALSRAGAALLAANIAPGALHDAFVAALGVKAEIEINPDLVKTMIQRVLS